MKKQIIAILLPVVLIMIIGFQSCEETMEFEETPNTEMGDSLGSGIVDSLGAASDSVPNDSSNVDPGTMPSDSSNVIPDPEPSDSSGITPEPNDSSSITPEPNDSSGVTPEPNDSSDIVPGPAPEDSLGVAVYYFPAEYENSVSMIYRDIRLSVIPKGNNYAIRNKPFQLQT